MNNFIVRRVVPLGESTYFGFFQRDAGTPATRDPATMVGTLKVNPAGDYQLDGCMMMCSPHAQILGQYKDGIRTGNLIKRTTAGLVHLAHMGDLDSTKFDRTGRRDAGIVFPNGNIYIGETIAGKRDGQGALALPCGDLYNGGWEKDFKHGTGVELNEHGIYCGEYARGDPHGFGRIELTNGDSYKGTFKEGAFDGQGVFTMANRCCYQGGFKNGDFNGDGTFYHSFDDSCYTGFFKDGRLEGAATIEWVDCTLITNFSEDPMPMAATLHPFNVSYKGTLINGFISGMGSYRNEYGAIFKGLFHEGCRIGRFHVTFTDGSDYEGGLDAYGLLHCKEGVYRSMPDGIVYEGEFMAGIATGLGTTTLPDGSKYAGAPPRIHVSPPWHTVGRCGVFVLPDSLPAGLILCASARGININPVLPPLSGSPRGDNEPDLSPSTLVPPLSGSPTCELAPSG